MTTSLPEEEKSLALIHEEQTVSRTATLYSAQRTKKNIHLCSQFRMIQFNLLSRHRTDHTYALKNPKTIHWFKKTRTRVYKIYEESANLRESICPNNYSQNNYSCSPKRSFRHRDPRTVCHARLFIFLTHDFFAKTRQIGTHVPRHFLHNTECAANIIGKTISDWPRAIKNVATVPLIFIMASSRTTWQTR